MSQHMDQTRKLPFGRVVSQADARKYYQAVAILAGCIGISHRFWIAAAKPFYAPIAYAVISGVLTMLIMLMVFYIADRKLGSEAPRVTAGFVIAYLMFAVVDWFTSPWTLLAAILGCAALFYIETTIVARRAAPQILTVETRWPGDPDSTETR